MLVQQTHIYTRNIYKPPPKNVSTFVVLQLFYSVMQNSPTSASVDMSARAMALSKRGGGARTRCAPSAPLGIYGFFRLTTTQVEQLLGKGYCETRQLTRARPGHKSLTYGTGRRRILGRGHTQRPVPARLHTLALFHRTSHPTGALAACCVDS